VASRADLIAPNLRGPPVVQRAIHIQNRQNLERLSQVGSEGATPAMLGIDAILLERMVSRRWADRLPPPAPGESYSYRITEEGIRLLIPK
jgi:hypothetical protein